MFDKRLKVFENNLKTKGIEFGLIGPNDKDIIWQRHILNCLSLSFLIDKKLSVADIGSGAGLPGIVLALNRGDLKITLIESMQRRCRWLETQKEEFALENVNIIHAPAQEVKEKFDIVIARAVAPLDKLIKISHGLTKSKMLFLKGQNIYDEIKKAEKIIKQFKLNFEIIEKDFFNIGQKQIIFKAKI